MKNHNLLLVDDDRQLLDSMAAWLREQGYTVFTADSCGQAREQVESHPPDLVLVDVRLNDGDGFEVLAWCRKHHPQLTVVLITGYGTVETGVEALRAGAFDLLTKPLIDEELAMALERALSQKKV